MQNFMHLNCTLGIIESLTGFRTHVHEPQDLAYLERQPEIAAVGSGAAAALNDIEAVQALYWPVVSNR